MSGADSPWQRADGRCAVALHLVLSWLEGEQLARAGAACREWRRAAADPALWRRLLLRRVAASPRARAELLATTESCKWREELVCAAAPWRACGSEAAGEGAALQHAALAPDQRWLALAAADAAVSVWERCGRAWRPRCRRDLRTERGWASAARLHWAASGRRLLVAGPLALADVASSWELLVLQFDDACVGCVVSRARCSGGAAGCWAGAAGDAFLSLQTSVLAPGVACTAVWLNAATQETQSEYAGVTSRLLRVYNEHSANVVHALVLELPWSALDAAPAAGDMVSYYRATRAARVLNQHSADDEEGEWSQLRLLVLAWDGGRGADGARRGGGHVSAWALGAPQPPPLHASAAGSLRARYLAHRERLRAPPPPAPAPDERSVRALCTAPEAACALPAPPTGLAPHPGGRCLWVSSADGQVVCVSLPALVPLRSLRPPDCESASLATIALPSLHYAQPAASWHHVAACAGGEPGARRGVCVWAALGGAGATLLPHAAPVTAALLPAAWPLQMLVLAGDAFHKFQYPAVGGRTATTTCAGSGPPAAPPPCTPHAKPPCRARPATSVRALRVVCRPRPAGHRPPCPQHQPAGSITCADITTSAESHQCARSGSEDASGSSCSGTHGGCGADRDRVARRLAQAKAARRADYEREANAPRERSGGVPRSRYRLGCERESARATDGRDYTIIGDCPSECPARCGPCRVQSPPRCVELAPDDACRIHAGADLDPCAHRPRVLVQIDRTPPERPPCRAAPPEPLAQQQTCEPACATPHTKTLKSRILQTLTQGRRPPDNSANPKNFKCTSNHQHGSRRLHTWTRLPLAISARSYAKQSSPAEQADKLANVLRGREELKEAGVGRVVFGSLTKLNSCQSPAVSGHLDLPVPVGVRRVSVRVALESDSGETPTPRSAVNECSGLSPGGGSCGGSAVSGSRDSWLLIKSLQKKLSSCKRTDDMKSKQQGESCGSKTSKPPSSPCSAPQCPPPCAPSRATPPPPAPASKPCPPVAPCPPNKAKPKTKDEVKPQCRFVPLTAFPML